MKYDDGDTFYILLFWEGEVFGRVRWGGVGWMGSNLFLYFKKEEKKLSVLNNSQL